LTFWVMAIAEVNKYLVRVYVRLLEPIATSVESFKVMGGEEAAGEVYIYEGFYAFPRLMRVNLKLPLNDPHDVGNIVPHDR